MVYRVLIFAGVREAGPGSPGAINLRQRQRIVADTGIYTLCDVCTVGPESRHQSYAPPCLLWAITGLMHCSEESLFDQLVSPP